MKGKVGFGGALDTRLVRPHRPHSARGVRVPGGRVLFTRDKGDALLFSREHFLSNLSMIHRGPDGRIKDIRDLGSGLVTNAGVNLMSYDFTWAGGATLKQANFHGIGTGTTAATSSDVWLQTQQTSSLSGTTNGYMTGTQSIIANSTSTPWSPVYQTVATFTFTGAVAVTEWILAIGNGANFSGTATSTTSTSLTNTGAAFTTAGNGLQAWTVEALASGTIPINTPGTTPMLQVLSNTATALTGLDNVWTAGTKTWLGINNQAQATPSGTTLYVAFPTAWDHKVFSVVNTANGDTIQFTYQLSINSGG